MKYRTLSFMGATGYRVGKDGSIWTRWTVGRASVITSEWRLMHPSLDKRGYLTVMLAMDSGKKKRFFLHTLVLLAFVGPKPKGMEARHYPDDTKTNVTLNNLCWGTRLENRKDMIEHGTRNRGERHGLSKLTIQDVTDARDMYSSGRWTQDVIGKIFGVSRATIGDIIRGATWTYK